MSLYNLVTDDFKEYDFDTEYCLRDRPFNLKGGGGGGGLWFFVSFRNFFSDNTRVRILFFCRAKREFFFKNLSLGYITKTLNQIIFIFLRQNQNIFFSNIGNQNIFLEENHAYLCMLYTA